MKSDEQTMSTSAEVMHQAFDVERVRADFPALAQVVHGKPLVYLDNAASAQKPQAMIDAVADAYVHNYANVHRGVHTLSQRATDAYEKARETGRRFLGAGQADELVFVRGVTEAVNLVAQSFLRPRLSAGDEIVLSAMEHHSNLVPWQMVAEATGARLRIIPVDDQGALDLDAYEALLGPKTRMVSVVHVSNAIGTTNPVRTMIDTARERGIPTMIDGAQAAPHVPIDVRALGCDFYAISGHKVYGPTGIGLLYGRAERLDAMVPYQGGGEMILTVSYERSEYNVAPHRFEAGTPNIVGAIGLGAALEYVESVGLEAIAAHEHDLLVYATERLGSMPAIRLVGTAEGKAAVVSFVVEGVHAHDIGTILDLEGVAIRAGHHCAQPLMDRFGVAATVRASFGLYNTREEIDRLVGALEKAVEIFAP